MVEQSSIHCKIKEWTITLSQWRSPMNLQIWNRMLLNKGTITAKRRNCLQQINSTHEIPRFLCYGGNISINSIIVWQWWMTVIWHRRIIWTIPAGKLTPQMANVGSLSSFVDRLGVSTELENLASTSLKVFTEILSSERVSFADSDVPSKITSLLRCS